MPSSTMNDETPQTSTEWEVELGSDLSRASTAPRPTSTMPQGADLARLTTLARSNTIRMTTDAFEKLYLSPQNRVAGDLRQTFAVPTPIALIGFIIGAGPLGIALMGWRGAGGGGVATIGVSYYFGGFLQVLGAVMEWIMGNTFPFVCFGTFGAFFLAYAATLDPTYGARAFYLEGATTPEEIAAGTAEYENTIGFFFLFMGILCILFCVCALRTNVVFFTNCCLIELAICFLIASTWTGAEGHKSTQVALSKASGACIFATCMLAFYLLFAQLLESVAFPLDLPVGDLSSRFGRTKKVPKLPPMAAEEKYDV